MRTREEKGMTIVEALVATLLLVVGLLGTFVVLASSGRRTAGTRSLEAATGLARQITETAHGVAWTHLTSAALPAELQAAAPGGLADADPATPGWQVRRRGVTYTLTASVCAIDDPADGYGSHPAGADPPWCRSYAAGSADGDAVDARQVTVTAVWSEGPHGRSASQSTVVTPADANSTGSASVTLSNLRVTSPALLDGQVASCASPSASCTSSVSASSTGITRVDLALDVTGSPASLVWYVNGTNEGTVTGSGGTRTMTWTLDPSSSPLPDGNYTVSVRAYDDSGAAVASPVTQTVTLNRFAPDATAFVVKGGPDGLFSSSGRTADAEWTTTTASGRYDHDLISLQLGRADLSLTGTAAGGPQRPSIACDTMSLATASCIDTGLGASSAHDVRYVVLPRDRWPNGSDRVAPVSLTSSTPGISTNVNATNGAPPAPTGVTATVSGGQVTLAWTPATVTVGRTPYYDPDREPLDSFRVYRDGSRRADRVARTDLGCDAAPPCTTTSATFPAVAGTHVYRVTAVDDRLNESPLSAATGGVAG